MATNRIVSGLQLADVPVLPVAHRIPEFKSPKNDLVQRVEALKDIPVQAARRKADIQESQMRTEAAKGATKRTQNLNALMPDTADDFDLAITTQYAKEFGRPPIDPVTGKIDLPKIADRVAKAQESRRRLEENAAAAKGHEVKEYTIDDDKGVPQLWREVIDAQGNSISKRLLGPDSKAIASRRTQIKASTEQSQELININDTLDKIKEAKELTKPGSKDVVGPVAGTIGPTASFVGAAIGGKDSEDFRARQAKIRFLQGELTMALTSKLKGPLSEKELAFLRAAVPKLTDDNSVWQDFLTRFEKTLQAKQTVLDGAALAETPAAVETQQAPAMTPSAEKPRVQVKPWPADPSKVVVKTLEGKNLIMTREEAEVYMKQVESASSPVSDLSQVPVKSTPARTPSDLPAITPTLLDVRINPEK